MRSARSRGIAAAISVALMTAGANLPFVPSWQPAKLAIIVTGTLIALWFGIGAVLRSALLRRRGWVITIVAGVTSSALTLVLALLVVASAYDFPGLEGEELVATKAIPMGRVVFVYEYSRLLDGVLATRVAIRESWLPFERTLLTVPANFEEAHQDDQALRLSFSGGRIAQYSFASGQIELIEPR